MIELSRTQAHVIVAAIVTIVVGCIVGVAGRLTTAGVYLAIAAFCLTAIGFADALGGTLGWGGTESPRINVASPEWLVRLLGWILLLIVSCLSLFGACSGHHAA